MREGGNGRIEATVRKKRKDGDCEMLRERNDKRRAEELRYIETKTRDFAEKRSKYNVN